MGNPQARLQMQHEVSYHMLYDTPPLERANFHLISPTQCTKAVAKNLINGCHHRQPRLGFGGVV